MKQKILAAFLGAVTALLALTGSRRGASAGATAWSVPVPAAKPADPPPEEPPLRCGFVDACPPRSLRFEQRNWNDGTNVSLVLDLSSDPGTARLEDVGTEVTLPLEPEERSELARVLLDGKLLRELDGADATGTLGERDATIFDLEASFQDRTTSTSGVLGYYAPGLEARLGPLLATLRRIAERLSLAVPPSPAESSAEPAESPAEASVPTKQQQRGLTRVLGERCGAVR